MKKEDLINFKKRLEKERDDLEKMMAEFHKNVEFTDVLSEDEVADIFESTQAEEVLEENIKKRISKINLALKKIEEGSYGICEKCGQPIEKERLEVDPTSFFCSKHLNML